MGMWYSSKSCDYQLNHARSNQNQSLSQPAFHIGFELFHAFGTFIQRMFYSTSSCAPGKDGDTRFNIVQNLFINNNR